VYPTNVEQICNGLVEVLKLECTIEHGGYKINGLYLLYRDVLLVQKLPPPNCSIAETCLSAEKTMRRHIALVTVKLLHRETPEFISSNV